MKVMARLRNVQIHVSTHEPGLESHWRPSRTAATERYGVRGQNPAKTGVCVPSAGWRKARRVVRSCCTPMEVDVHLNPKIGLDWMNRGQQKEVVTPGKNEKRYLAGALDSATGRLICVEGMRKTSELFISLLARLVEEYPCAKRIHLILDNYRIHHSAITKTALRHFARRSSCTSYRRIAPTTTRSNVCGRTCTPR